jgi:hypothetical protein
MLTMHVPVPLHPSPLQPAKEKPLETLAARVTGVPNGKVAVQVAPQSRPVGAEVTLPVPVPFLVKERAILRRSKVAVTLRAWLIVSAQVNAVPLQAPPQPVKVEVASEDAVRVTGAATGNSTAQVVPQLIPAGAEATVPVPVPCRVTVRE